MLVADVRSDRAVVVGQQRNFLEFFGNLGSIDMGEVSRKRGRGNEGAGLLAWALLFSLRLPSLNEVFDILMHLTLYFRGVEVWDELKRSGAGWGDVAAQPAQLRLLFDMLQH